MTKRVCWCPCKASLEGMRTDAVWKSKACALRWRRENPGKELPGRNNAHIIDTRSRSGLQLSYRKAVGEVAHLIRPLALSPGEATALAEQTLSRALPVRQRALIDARNKKAQRSKEAA